jgi:DNA replication protein DnaC
MFWQLNAEIAQASAARPGKSATGWLRQAERREVWEICEDCYQTRSTILTSQLPVSRCHEQVGDPTIADGILDRLVHNAHRIEMRGESMRKKRNPARDENDEKKE